MTVGSLWLFPPFPKFYFIFFLVVRGLLKKKKKANRGPEYSGLQASDSQGPCTGRRERQTEPQPAVLRVQDPGGEKGDSAGRTGGPGAGGAGAGAKGQRCE